MNKKLILKEAENTTVNDEQLMGLYDAAAKTEGQIINLAVAAMKFSNPEIKRAVTALKSQANQLVNLIATSMENNNGSDLGLVTDDSSMPNMIDAAPSADNMIENTNSNGSAMNIMEAKRRQVAKLMYENNLDFNTATQIVEKFDPSIFDKNKDEKEEPKEEELEEAVEPKDEIDIEKECSTIKEGLSVRDFSNFKSVLVENLNRKKFGKKYKAVVEAISNSKSISDLNEAIDHLYNYADANNIKIKA